MVGMKWTIVDVECKEQWDDIVKSFSSYDVYYLNGYVRAFYIHGDGIPQLIYYEADRLRAMYVYMKRSTSLVGVYDSITPYGYGGVLFEGDVNEVNVQIFWEGYVAKMQDLGIVDGFVRYHPVLNNAEPMRFISEVVDLGQTIAIDLTSPEVIWSNISSKNRNMIRKAEKNGVVIYHSDDPMLFTIFKEIYNATMDRDQASPYYYFRDDFYKSISEDLYGNYQIFYAVYNDEVIAMSIIIYANTQMHYHLSGSRVEYRHLAPSNLLLYKAALWGYEHGFKTFHLGGGVGSGCDSLFKFKSAFNRNSQYQFSIAKQIFNYEMYNRLVDIRIIEDSTFNRESSFFPLYRS